MGKLNYKQKKFVDYYCQTGNAAQSAIMAGYSEKTARSQGQRMLTKVDVKHAIEKRNKELEDERIADVTEIKQFWTSMFRDPMSESKDRIKASELLARTAGAFIDKVEHSGGTNNTVSLDGLDRDDLKALARMEIEGDENTKA